MAGTNDIDLDALLDGSGDGLPKGHSVRDLGPSDSSDTGADMMGLGGLDHTGDRNGTGERASVEGEEDLEGDDVAPDSVVDADRAGLGRGLDQAEEARLGVTDEELESAVRQRAGAED